GLPEQLNKRMNEVQALRPEGAWSHPFPWQPDSVPCHGSHSPRGGAMGSRRGDSGPSAGATAGSTAGATKSQSRGGDACGVDPACTCRVIPAGPGTGCRRGPHRLATLLPSTGGTICDGQEAPSQHTGNCWFGTVRKGWRVCSKAHDGKASLDSVPGAGCWRTSQACAPPLRSPPYDSPLCSHSGPVHDQHPGPSSPAAARLPLNPSLPSPTPVLPQSSATPPPSQDSFLDPILSPPRFGPPPPHSPVPSARSQSVKVQGQGRWPPSPRPLISEVKGNPGVRRS
ncbi:hypothetical protein EI555_006763, partial [Monodon monoceros]